MPKRLNLVGQRLGKLTVLRLAGVNDHGRRLWECRCDCGATVIVRADLSRHPVRSCGCAGRAFRIDQITRHGEAALARKTPEYRAWVNMIHRCENQTQKDFRNYGGRGIRVCPEWRADYSVFLAKVGRRPSPSHSIDRIDNDGNYEPGNVRWATKREQRANQRFVRRQRVFSRPRSRL